MNRHRYADREVAAGSQAFADLEVFYMTYAKKIHKSLLFLRVFNISSNTSSSPPSSSSSSSASSSASSSPSSSPPNSLSWFPAYSSSSNSAHPRKMFYWKQVLLHIRASENKNLFMHRRIFNSKLGELLQVQPSYF